MLSVFFRAWVKAYAASVGVAAVSTPLAWMSAPQGVTAESWGVVYGIALAAAVVIAGIPAMWEVEETRNRADGI